MDSEQAAAEAGTREQGVPKGVMIVERVLATLPLTPGVYRMLDAKGDALYVGKAKSLKKRVYSYTQVARLPERLRRMVAETAAMEIVTTHTEAEALLLEANLIKRLRPRFNIVLRDDKSYPWLLLTEDHAYPQIAKHRGARTRRGSYYGPFASAWAVNQTVNAMQRVFLLRSCQDTVFANRTRPCLLHQIRRCSAPCVGRISEEDYGRLVAQARAFLGGKAGRVQQELAREMEDAAEHLEFERAAAVRDRIRGLTHVQGTGVVNPESIADADVVAAWQAGGQTCVQVFFVRGGRNNGNRAFYPAHARDEEAGDVLAAFLAQFYDDKPPPQLVLLNHEIAEQALVAEALSLKAQSFKSGRRVEVAVPRRGEKRAVVLHAETNAREALERRMAESAGQAKLLEGVAQTFGLPGTPERIECYDNSHIMGAHAYGVMVVAGPEGFEKNHYRKYGIKGPVAPGDDFAMMREVLERRFGRALAEGEAAVLPDLVLIDGGAGQLSAAKAVMHDLGMHQVPLVAIAKGPDRDAGREWFHMEDRPAFQLPPRDPVLYYLQRVRDEAHRFAITTHRAGRSRAIRTSELDEIAGVGAARKRALLNHFGSARGVKAAGLADLEAAPGINRETARRVYAYFHPGAAVEAV
jgi:excinuclease ABC subunit C